MASISRNAEVLRYLLGIAPELSMTQLMKFAYLTDLESRRYLGKPISNFAYVFYEHGPFDKTIYRTVEELGEQLLVTKEDVFFPSGARGTYVRPTDRAVAYHFSQAEAEILRYVAETYMRLNVRALCEDVVYETPPMKNATRGQLLDMAMLDNEERGEFGFNLERVLESEAQVAAGQHRSLSEALDELFPPDHAAR